MLASHGAGQQGMRLAVLFVVFRGRVEIGRLPLRKLVAQLHDLAAGQLDGQQKGLVAFGQHGGRKHRPAHAFHGKGHVQLAAFRDRPPAGYQIPVDLHPRGPHRLIEAADVRAMHLGPVTQHLGGVHEEPHYAHRGFSPR